MATIEPLDPDKIKVNLNTKRVGSDVVVYKRTTSTNDVAARYSPTPENDGLAVFAEQQTQGRGRTGAKWHSRPGHCILCSILLTNPPCSIEMLSLTAAVAVADCIGQTTANAARIKWPNDIFLNGKKVAGILLETKTTAATTAQIIGIGINCHQLLNDFPPEIRPIATSIDIESGSTSDRTSIARRLLSSLDQWLKIAAQSPKKVTDRWRQLSIQLNHRVTLVYNGRKFAGNCIDIDPEKGLVLQLDTGSVRMFHAAHTSVYKDD